MLHTRHFSKFCNLDYIQETELIRKEEELTRAEENIRREQQQIQEMRQRVSPVCGVVCVVTRGSPDCRRLS